MIMESTGPVVVLALTGRHSNIARIKIEVQDEDGDEVAYQMVLIDPRRPQGWHCTVCGAPDDQNVPLLPPERMCPHMGHAAVLLDEALGTHLAPRARERWIEQ